jgi:sulfur transfer protein SufE
VSGTRAERTNPVCGCKELVTRCRARETPNGPQAERTDPVRGCREHVWVIRRQDPRKEQRVPR